MNATNKWMAAFRAADGVAPDISVAPPVAESAVCAVSPAPRTSYAGMGGFVGLDGRRERAAADHASAAFEPIGTNCAKYSAWTHEDWVAFFHERAGLAADDGISEPDVLSRAFEDCVEEWLRRQPQPEAPDRCAHCGRRDRKADPLAPFGTISTARWWLHPDCQPAWSVARRAAAVAALGAVGVTSHGILRQPPGANDNGGGAADGTPVPAVRAEPDAGGGQSMLQSSVFVAAPASELSAATSISPMLQDVVLSEEAETEGAGPAHPPRAARRRCCSLARAARALRRGRSPFRQWRGPSDLLFHAIVHYAQNHLPLTFGADDLRARIDHPRLAAEVQRMVAAGFLEEAGADTFRLVEKYRKQRSRRW